MSEPHDAADGLVRVYPADDTTARPTPGLVWAHGGGFAAGDLDMPEADWVARSFAAHGVTVVSVDYRLVGAGCRYPAPSDDVLAAWRWAVEHADGLGVDPSRLVVGGASAGANLAAGAVLRMLDETRGLRRREAPSRNPGVLGSDHGTPPEPAPRSAAPLPAGVFLAYPTLLAVQPAPDAALRALLDANPAADRFDPASVRAMYEGYVGGPVDDAPLPVVPGRAAASDLAGFPPVLMINGEADELRVSGEVFAATLVEAGVPLELHVEPGTEHGHLNRPDEPAASDSIERVMRWIAGLETPAARASRPADPRTAASGPRPADGHQTTLRTTEGITS